MDTSKIKMVVFDIDGTLIAEREHKIQASAVTAIHALHDKGIKVLVATGRAPYFIKPHVFEVIDSDYYVTINGQCVMNRQHEIISRHDLNKSDIQQLLTLCKKENIALGCKCSNQIVVLHDYDRFVEYYGHGEQPNGRFLDGSSSIDILDKDMAMGLFLVGDVQKIIDHKDDFPQWTFSRAFSWGLDIFDKDVHKSKGIEDVLEILGLSWEEVMVFGDADNDLRMIEKAGIGIAMGNGTENLKKIADYVTSDLDKDGIYNGLKHFKLI
jgi:Cof subfamily protein (haloacid dehalogenase superfamily)